MSSFPERVSTRWIVGQRPPRVPVDPRRPHACFLEDERSASDRVLRSACILLTGKECPWRCLMCDLWKHTLPYPTPPGAIPAQIDFALDQLCQVSRYGAGETAGGMPAELAGETPALRGRPEQIKLYNSGSFFDSAAVPVADYPAVAKRVAFVANVVVESHPRLIGERALRFRDLLSGSLEVAIGLETVHPTVLPRLNKRFNLDHFAGAAEFLRRNGIALRAFVLVKPPFLDEEQAVEWAVKSSQFAFDCGATAVSFIPTRPGNGALDRLMESGEFSPPRLATLERAQERALELSAGRVFADTWDLQLFSSCSACLPERQQRLHRMNLEQRILPPVACGKCGGIQAGTIQKRNANRR